MEQGLAPPEAKAAILGDGKLGLLIAEVLARRVIASPTTIPTPDGEGGGGSGDRARSAGSGTTTLIGRHKEKMDLCCAGADGSGDAVRDECSGDEHFYVGLRLRSEMTH